MQTTDLIIVNDYCEKCHIEPSFLEMLQQGGLIEIDTVEGENYLSAAQLPDIESYARMYYDLSINIEGIDAIHHMLKRIKTMQKEIGRLKKELRIYEKGNLDDMIDIY
jgi:chaperone modulatory protein CbpM